MHNFYKILYKYLIYTLLKQTNKNVFHHFFELLRKSSCHTLQCCEVVNKKLYMFACITLSSTPKYIAPRPATPAPLLVEQEGEVDHGGEPGVGVVHDEVVPEPGEVER